LSDEFVISVKDSGIGIKAEDMCRILTPFGQIRSVYSRDHRGSGLGLILTKALIEEHGGRLELHSEAGVGTTVHLRFPLDRLASSPAARQRAVGSAAAR
jgi:signal transduction histidine kinase